MTMQIPGRPDFDILLIGSGLAATACARSLAQGGARVGIVPGVGRSRSLDVDGGLVDPQLVEQAFGAHAPLGQTISRRQHFSATGVLAAPELGPVEEMPARRCYSRLQLESWAQQRAVEAGAEFLSDFVEGKVLPTTEGTLRLSDEPGTRTLTAGWVLLCEGQDPRISMRVGLRPDYGPEDQLHFARTRIEQSDRTAVYRTGSTRTSWGMPIQVTILPTGEGTIVSVVARIENIMRSGRSSRDALEDLLSSELGAELGLEGARTHTGVELVAMRSPSRDVRLSQDTLLMGIDASGLTDPREARRADVAIQSGIHLAGFVTGDRSRSWDEFADPLLAQVRAVNARWYESRSSGFLEESSEGHGLAESIDRVRSGMLRRLRVRP